MKSAKLPIGKLTAADKEEEALRWLQTIKQDIEKMEWTLGLLGGETIGSKKVPAQVKKIWDRINIALAAPASSHVDVLFDIAKLGLTAALTASRSRSRETQRYYDQFRMQTPFAHLFSTQQMIRLWGMELMQIEQKVERTCQEQRAADAELIHEDIHQHFQVGVTLIREYLTTLSKEIKALMQHKHMPKEVTDFLVATVERIKTSESIDEMSLYIKDFKSVLNQMTITKQNQAASVTEAVKQLGDSQRTITVALDSYAAIRKEIDSNLDQQANRFYAQALSMLFTKSVGLIYDFPFSALAEDAASTGLSGAQMLKQGFEYEYSQEYYSVPTAPDYARLAIDFVKLELEGRSPNLTLTAANIIGAVVFPPLLLYAAAGKMQVQMSELVSTYLSQVEMTNRSTKRMDAHAGERDELEKVLAASTTKKVVQSLHTTKEGQVKALSGNPHTEAKEVKHPPQMKVAKNDPLMAPYTVGRKIK